MKEEPEPSSRRQDVTTNGLLSNIVAILKVLAMFDLTKLVTLAVIIAGGFLLWASRMDFRSTQDGILRNQQMILSIMDNQEKSEVRRSDEYLKQHEITHRRLDNIEKLLRRKLPPDEEPCPMPPVEQ